MSNIVDKKQADGLMAKCRAALAEVLAAEGFEISKVSGKYGDSFGFSVSAIPSVKNEYGLNPNAPQVVDYQRYHNLFNLPDNALGVRFTVGSKDYTFEGVQMSRRKFPIAVHDHATNKKVLLTEDVRVVSAITAAAEARAQAAPAAAEPPANKPAARRAPK